MTTRLRSATFAAALVLSLPAGAALAQNYAPPVNVPIAAAVGASASPLVGQGYLPYSGNHEPGVSTEFFRMEHRFGGQVRTR